MLTPQQRADAARRRILEAATSLSGPPANHTVSGRKKPQFLKGVALALLGGFLVGYSPLVRAVVIKNADSLLRELLCLKV
jgi:hypothetical protein